MRASYAIPSSKQVSSCTCILIIMIVSSHLAPACEARRLMEATTTSNAKEACESAGCHAVQGASSIASTTKMASTDGRSTAPGHSPGIGNKLHAAGNDRR